MFFDVWQSQSKPNIKIGPLIPSTHQITDPRKCYIIKREISRLWKLSTTRATNPSPLPVSLELKDLETLKNENYAVSEKTDGVRYLLLLMRWPREFGEHPSAIMCSRKYDMYEVRVIAREEYFRGTLLDGELAWEYEAPNTYTPPRQIFFAFDIIAKCGISYVQETFTKRYSALFDCIDVGKEDITNDPRKWTDISKGLAENNKIVCEGNQYCMCFKPKRFFSKQQLPVAWRDRTKEIKHKSDGLIFVPIDSGLCTGTQYDMFKWKSHHTIDLSWTCHITYDNNNSGGGEERHVISYGDGPKACYGDVDGVFLPPVMVNINMHDMYQYDHVPIVMIPNEYTHQIIQWHRNKTDTQFTHIVECSCLLPKDTDWFSNDTIPIVECSILKIRHDKLQPNQKITIERTLNNIRENITIKDLIDSVLGSDHLES